LHQFSKKIDRKEKEDKTEFPSPSCLIFRVVWNPKRDKSVVTTLIYCTAYLDHTTVANSSGTTKNQVAESSDSQVAQPSFLATW